MRPEAVRLAPHDAEIVGGPSLRGLAPPGHRCRACFVRATNPRGIDPRPSAWRCSWKKAIVSPSPRRGPQCLAIQFPRQTGFRYFNAVLGKSCEKRDWPPPRPSRAPPPLCALAARYELAQVLDRTEPVRMRR